MAQVNVQELYKIGGCLVSVHSFNDEYFRESQDVFNAYGLMISNFSNSEFNEFVDFLKDSVANNPYLNDMIREQNFDVKNGTISFIEDGEEFSAVLMGEITLPHLCRVYLSGGYAYVHDTKSDKKYIYYGD